jgi:hypothetical protein
VRRQLRGEPHYPPVYGVRWSIRCWVWHGVPLHGCRAGHVRYGRVSPGGGAEGQRQSDQSRGGASPAPNNALELTGKKLALFPSQLSAGVRLLSLYDIIQTLGLKSVILIPT